MFQSKKTFYSPLNQDHDPNASLEKLLPEPQDNDSQFVGIVRKRSWRRWLPSVANGLFLCFSLLFFLYSVNKTPTDIQCGKQLSTYSPALEAIEYENIVFNGTLDWPSPYRGQPNDDVDAAWGRISRNVMPIRVDKDTILRAGSQIRPSTVRFRDEDGGGYMAQIEVIHELHCLDILRRVTYKDYYESRDTFFQQSPEFVRTRVDHCIEILRQNLMCIADTGVITYEWVHGFSSPYPDFNTLHKCRNFEKVLGWIYDHGVDIPQQRITRLEDTIDLPEDP